MEGVRGLEPLISGLQPLALYHLSYTPILNGGLGRTRTSSVSLNVTGLQPAAFNQFGTPTHYIIFKVVEGAGVEPALAVRPTSLQLVCFTILCINYRVRKTVG